MLTVEVERLRLTPGTRLLDVGCGGGRHIRASRHLPGVRAVAVDLGAKEVEETRASLELLDKLPAADGGSIAEAGPWGVTRGSVYELPFADASFDCIIISEVLEHLHREHDALRDDLAVDLEVPLGGLPPREEPQDAFAAGLAQGAAALGRV